MKFQDSSFNGLKVTVGTKSVTHARTHPRSKSNMPHQLFQNWGHKNTAHFHDYPPQLVTVGPRLQMTSALIYCLLGKPSIFSVTVSNLSPVTNNLFFFNLESSKEGKNIYGSRTHAVCKDGSHGPNSLVVRASASGAVDRGLAPRSCHTKGVKNGTSSSLADACIKG